MSKTTRKQPYEKHLYALQEILGHLISVRMWDKVKRCLFDIRYLEVKAEAGMLFELAADFTCAVESVPPSKPWYRVIRLLEEAIRRDINFLHRHPSSLFQCLWNSCYWYDCPEAMAHYSSDEEQPKGGVLWKQDGPKLYELLREWREAKEQVSPNFIWIRSRRPPFLSLGCLGKSIFDGSEGSIRTTRFDDSGKHIVSGGTDQFVRVWDLQRGKEIYRLENNSPILCLDVSEDGKEIVFGCTDGQVKIWRISEGQHTTCIGRHDTAIVCVKYSTDKRKIAACSENSLSVWDSQSHKNLQTISAGFRHFAFSPDNKVIVTAQAFNQIGIWDIENAQEVRLYSGYRRRFAGHKSIVNAVAFSPCGELIASCSGDKTVRVWDLHSGKELWCFRGHIDEVRGIVFSDNGKYLVSGSLDCTVRVWDMEKKIQVKVFRTENGISCLDLFSENGRIVCGAGLAIEIWNIESDNTSVTCQDHEDCIWHVGLTPDLNRVFTGSDDKTIRFWDLESGEEKLCIDGLEDYIESIAIDPSGSIIASALSNHTVKLWNADTGKEILKLEEPKSCISRLFFVSKGQQLIAVSIEDSLWIWNIPQGTEAFYLPGIGKGAHNLAISPLEDKVAVGMKCGAINIIETQKSIKKTTLMGHNCSVRAVKFSLHNNLLVSGSVDGTVCLWDSNTGEQLHSINAHIASIEDVAISKNGRWAASTSKDHSIRVWDVTSGRQVSCISMTECTVEQIAFTSGDLVYLVGWAHPKVWLWDIHSANCLEYYEGLNDIGIFNGAKNLYSYLPLKSKIETTIYSRPEKTPIAWLPQGIQVALVHPSGRIWVSAYDTKHLGIFSLEGNGTYSKSV